MINISPQRTDGPEGADWLAVPPGTDTALMLGLAFALEEARRSTAASSTAARSGASGSAPI